jgi:hypothetical protein
MTSAGERTFDLSGIVVRVLGLPEELDDALARRWSAFVAAAAEPHLTVVLGDAPGPAAAAEASPVDMGDDSAAARFETSGGGIVVDPAGRAELRLALASTPEELHTLINLLLAAVAHVAPYRGALVVHGAGIVVDGRAYVLVGPSGSGKSTWVDLAAPIVHPISDDLLGIDASGRAVEVLALPFRRYPAPSAGPGRWPLGALLLPGHGPTARLEPAEPRVARAALLGNLPHIAPARRLNPVVSAVVDRIIAHARLRRLVFAKDPGFVDLLRSESRGQAP